MDLAVFITPPVPLRGICEAAALSLSLFGRRRTLIKRFSHFGQDQAGTDGFFAAS
jgi:hypothetical protein